jgi:hypothetical protein
MVVCICRRRHDKHARLAPPGDEIPARATAGVGVPIRLVMALHITFSIARSDFKSALKPNRSILCRRCRTLRRRLAWLMSCTWLPRQVSESEGRPHLSLS